MKILLVVIIAFLVLIYIYTYIKHKKRKKNNLNAVDSYRKNYIERINSKPGKISDDDSYRQITKYNSSLDYVEWNDFLSEIDELKHDSEPKQIKPKRLQY